MNFPIDFSILILFCKKKKYPKICKSIGMSNLYDKYKIIKKGNIILLYFNFIPNYIYTNKKA